MPLIPQHDRVPWSITDNLGQTPDAPSTRSSLQTEESRLLQFDGPVLVPLFAGDWPCPDLVGQGEGCCLSTPPSLTVFVTGLPTFGGVDPPEANPLSSDFYSVTVDNRSPASDIREGGACRKDWETSKARKKDKLL